MTTTTILMFLAVATLIVVGRKGLMMWSGRASRRKIARGGAVADATSYVRTLRNGWESRGLPMGGQTAKRVRTELFRIAGKHGITPSECGLRSWDEVKTMVDAIEAAEASRIRAKSRRTESGELELDIVQDPARDNAVREVREAYDRLKAAYAEQASMTAATAQGLRSTIIRLRREHKLSLQECGIIRWNSVDAAMDAIVLREQCAAKRRDRYRAIRPSVETVA